MSASNGTAASATASPNTNGRRPEIVATYDYKDARGILLFQVCRLEPGNDGAKKTFRQRIPIGKGWKWGLNGVEPTIYRLPELLASSADQTVFLVEGEKDVDNLRQKNCVATCNPMGAGKWRPGFNQHFKGRHVVIIPDNDEPGKKHAASVAKNLRGVAASVLILRLPDLPEKGDVSDWLSVAGNDKVKLLELVESELKRQDKSTVQEANVETDAQEVCFSNYSISTGDPPAKVGLSVATITAKLHSYTDGWPKRVGPTLFVQGTDQAPAWLQSAEALFAWISAQSPHANNFVRWSGGQDKVTQGQFFAHLMQASENFDAVEAFPHWPPLKAHHYMHREPVTADGKALLWLLNRFSPASLIDRDLILAWLLTLFWGGKPGQRPAFLIDVDGDDARGGRGAGKTKLAQAGAALVGGHVDVRPDEDIDKLLCRLLSPAALDRRVVLLDNVKALRFSWSDLEALVTADVISGKRLYVGEGRRPNTLLWTITSNRATLSRDMAQRCVPIRLKRPSHNPAWEADTFEFIENKRWEIIGDILNELKREVRPLAGFSRWSSWEQGVLAHVAEPTDCQKAIAEWQASVDADGDEASLVREGLIEALVAAGHDPVTAVVWIPSKRAAVIVNDATGENRAVNKAGAHLGTLTIPELRRSDRGWGNGWLWRGEKSEIDQTAVPMGSF